MIVIRMRQMRRTSDDGSLLDRKSFDLLEGSKLYDECYLSKLKRTKAKVTWKLDFNDWKNRGVVYDTNVHKAAMNGGET